MTTLKAAPTRHCHTENLSGERRRYLPKQHPEREGWGQKTTITTAHKSNESKMIDSLQKHCKITKALLNPETAPHTISEGDRWPALSHI